jgi:hypothetical protein
MAVSALRWKLMTESVRFSILQSPTLPLPPSRGAGREPRTESSCSRAERMVRMERPVRRCGLERRMTEHC